MNVMASKYTIANIFYELYDILLCCQMATKYLGKCYDIMSLDNEI